MEEGRKKQSGKKGKRKKITTKFTYQVSPAQISILEVIPTWF